MRLLTAGECVSYARLAVDERHTGRVAIAIGVPSGPLVDGCAANIGHGAPSITLDDRGDGGLGHTFRGHSTVVRPSAEALRWSLPEPRTDRFRVRQIQVRDWHAGSLRVVGQGDERDRRVPRRGGAALPVAVVASPVGSEYRVNFVPKCASDRVLWRVVCVWSGQEHGPPAARARRWVHEGAVGENVAHAGAPCRCGMREDSEPQGRNSIIDMATTGMPRLASRREVKAGRFRG